MAEPILKLLDMAPKRTETPPVSIDGTPYYFVVREELTLRRKASITRIGERMSELQQKSEPTEEDENEYNGLVREFAGMVLPDAPPEQLDQVGAGHLEPIVTLFFVTYADLFMMANMSRLVQDKRLIGEMLSQGFNGSTAAARTNGRT